MKRVAGLALGFAAVAVCANAQADDLSGASRLLCSAAQASACCDDGQCAAGTAADFNVPQFVEVDVPAKRLSTTKASGNPRTSTAANVTRADGQIVLQGMENGRAYSIMIDESSGDMSAAIAGSFGCGVTVFGSCTPISAPK